MPGEAVVEVRPRPTKVSSLAQELVLQTRIDFATPGWHRLLARLSPVSLSADYGLLWMFASSRLYAEERSPPPYTRTYGEPMKSLSPGDALVFHFWLLRLSYTASNVQRDHRLHGSLYTMLRGRLPLSGNLRPRGDAIACVSYTPHKDSIVPVELG